MTSSEPDVTMMDVVFEPGRASQNHEPTTEELKANIAILQKELNCMNLLLKNEQKKTVSLSKKVEMFAPSTNQKENLIQASARFLTPAALEIYKGQLNNFGREPQGRRHSDEMKIIAYALKKKSAGAYRLLSDIFIMPSDSTLENLQSKVEVEAGLCEPILEAMNKRVEKMTNWEKITVICVDEMNIKAFASYRKDKDFIEGFVDHGGERTNEYASQALVVNLHGLMSKWKQPIGFFISNGSIAAVDIHGIVMKTLKRLDEIGLDVRLLVADQGSNNQSLFKNYLGVTEEKPYFFHGDRKVFASYDPPHLLKSVRNNLLNKDFELNGEIVASWSHFVTFFEHDSTNSTQLQTAPKLAKWSHVEPSSFRRMKVRYAAQVFSNTVAAGMKTHIASSADKLSDPEAALRTAETFKKMDNLFDCFNSSSKFSPKPYKSAVTNDSIHWEYMDEMKEMFANLKCISFKKGKKVRSSPPCFKGWILAINCLQQLWQSLSQEEGVQYLTTRSVNQDPLENLFSVIRNQGGDRDNPTVAQFRDAFRYIMISACLDLHHSGGSNCEMDVAKTLFDHQSFDKSAPSTPQNRSDNEDQRTDDINLAIPSSLIEHSNDLQNNILFYIAGRVTMKYEKYHGNNTECLCLDNIRIPRQTAKFKSDHQLFTALKSYQQYDADFGGLSIPTEKFFEYISKLNTSFNRHFDDHVHEVGLLKTIKNGFINDNGPNPSQIIGTVCPKALNAAVDYFIRMRIHYCCKNISQELTSGKKLKENRKYRKLANL